MTCTPKDITFLIRTTPPDSDADWEVTITCATCERVNNALARDSWLPDDLFTFLVRLAHAHKGAGCEGGAAIFKRLDEQAREPDKRQAAQPAKTPHERFLAALAAGPPCGCGTHCGVNGCCSDCHRGIAVYDGPA